jgi:predicted SAM-dependent methyltransferase
MINKILEKVRIFLLFVPGAIVRKILKRKLPNNADGKVLVHIGCGEFDDKRYINIDSRLGWHIHYVDYAENVERIFRRESVDLVYACHVLEHISHSNLAKVLKSLKAILRKGGVLRLSVPDFSTISEIYNQNKRIEEIMYPLMGGQGYTENLHRSIFDEEFLKNILIKSGFSQVRRWDPANASYYNFNDWAGREFVAGGKSWKISLNLEAIK